VVLAFLCDAACTPLGERETAIVQMISSTMLLSVTLEILLELKRGFCRKEEVSLTELELKELNSHPVCYFKEIFSWITDTEGGCVCVMSTDTIRNSI